MYDTTRNELSKMVKLGGRDCERDIFNNYGRYPRIMHSKSVGTPCPVCTTSIKKQQYLGGAIYFCPSCQVLEE